MSVCRARLSAMAQGMCDQETCPDLNKCHVISAQNTLKVTRIGQILIHALINLCTRCFFFLQKWLFETSVLVPNTNKVPS